MNNTRDLQERTVVIDFTNGKSKSLVKLGYIKIYLENKFNWFQKKMFKLLLGIEIESREWLVNEYRNKFYEFWKFN